jgi:hypothetical protein
MNSIFTFVLSILFIATASADPSRQRASGETEDGLKWQVYFNFPACDHSNDGRKKGAWCEPTDITESQASNGIEANLFNWIKDSDTKSIFISFFSFSNKNVAAALCAETSLRSELNVTIFLDKGEGQVGALVNNIATLDDELADPNSKRYVPGYKKGCSERIRPRDTARGSGSFGGDGNYLQHSKIFMALDQAALPSGPAELNNWLKNTKKIRFTSSSANMSSYGTTLHFENWLFFEAPPTNYIAQQNLCTMMAFKAADSEDGQRAQFKKAYQSCEDEITAKKNSDLQFYIVPSVANNKKNGPEGILRKTINSAQKLVKVAIHRLTTNSVAGPLINKSQQGVPVKMIQDDDTLRASVVDGGSVADVGGYDVRILRMNLDAGIDVSFMETNSETTTHMFHNKFVVVDDKFVFQGAGNFTSSALNSGGKDGNYEQFYLISIPGLVRAYSQAWDYMRETSTRRQDHEVGKNEFYCTASFGQKKVRCDDSVAEDSHLVIPQ